MTQETFNQMQQAYATGGADAVFALLIETLTTKKDYAALFDALLMQRRHQLGISLLSHRSLSSLDKETRRKYEDAYMDICRQIGELYLADGDITNAWRYFRVIGELDPVREALERLDTPDPSDDLIAIAYQEGVHPRRGFEWIIRQHGVCRAISVYEQFPHGAEGKKECNAMLVRQLYLEVLETLRQSVAQREGAAPDSAGLAQLLATRPWLFDENYLVDISHVAAVARFSIELEDRELLRCAAELADYGRRLQDTGFYAAGMPVAEHLQDISVYLHALLEEDVDAGVAHFRKRIAENTQSDTGGGPAQLLVYLLVRLGRLEEAIDVSLEYLADVPVERLGLCPSIPQLCEMANNPQRLLDLARRENDLLTFTAGLLTSKATV